MQVHLVTLFPEFFASALDCGLMGKGRRDGLLDVACVNPRDFVTSGYKAVDDRPYGGGPGMVMQLEPLHKALASIPRPGPILLLTPRGAPFTQAMARDLAAEPAMTLLCGRYEGVDARLPDLLPIREVSLGDFVLNGGEAAALCILEAVARLLPGFMGDQASGEEESFSHNLLEYPHYTRPEEYQGLRVPAILQGGDHGAIARWRRQQSLRDTLARRPDLLADAPLHDADIAFLKDLEQTPHRTKLGRNLHLVHVHAPARLKNGRIGVASLTTFDIHDIARSSCCHGVGSLTLVTPLEDQQRLAHRVLEHWTQGAGSRVNANRAQALSMARVASTLEEALAQVEARCGEPPLVAATTARLDPPRGPWKKRWPAPATYGQLRQWLRERPVCLLLGAGHGMAPEALCQAQALLRPLRPFDAYNHFSVRAAAAVMLDRVLADVW